MSARETPATLALSAASVEFVVHEYAHDPAVTNFAQEASDALGVDEARVHKTLVISVDHAARTELVVAVIPADSMCDVKAVATAAGCKRASMADPRAAQRSTGYVLGGISPLGQRQKLRTFIDEEAQLFDTIFISAGRRGLDLELNPQDLAKLTDATFAAIAKRA